MTATNTTDSPALHAAYAALQPYTQHAQIRAELAERIVDTLRNYHQYAAVEVLYANWPDGITRINRTALTEVVQAAAAAMKEN